MGFDVMVVDSVQALFQAGSEALNAKLKACQDASAELEGIATRCGGVVEARRSSADEVSEEQRRSEALRDRHRVEAGERRSAISAVRSAAAELDCGAKRSAKSIERIGLAQEALEQLAAADAVDMAAELLEAKRRLVEAPGKAAAAVEPPAKGGLDASERASAEPSIVVVESASAALATSPRRAFSHEL